MIKNKKLAFSAVTVRQLTQNMTEDQLRGVAGGTGINNQPTHQCVVNQPNAPIQNTGGNWAANPRASLACPVSQGAGCTSNAIPTGQC